MYQQEAVLERLLLYQSFTKDCVRSTAFEVAIVVKTTLLNILLKMTMISTNQTFTAKG
jgi:hypothetical protein